MDFEQPNHGQNNENKVLEVKTSPPKFWHKLTVLVLIIGVSYWAGYQSGRKGYIFVPKEFKVIGQDQAPLTVDYKLLWSAIDAVNQNYIDKPVDQQKILYGAVKGAVAGVGDPYTVFFAPDELKNFQTDLKGSFSGIGAEIGLKNGNIVIVAPLDDSPAKKAGLLAKDAIVKVDGEATTGWTTDQAVSKIRGEKGTAVTLTIYREGRTKTFDVKIFRDEIKVKSVKWQVKTVGSKKIGVITLSRFGDDTKDLFTQAVNDLLKQSVDGIILDERDNPGGYLQTAVDLASDWLPAGELVVTEARSQGEPIKYTAEGNNRFSGIKTIVLINGGSASAAEILAGALHDHGAAMLLGEKSFGKGSVQELINLPGNSAVKVTVAKWITPNGKNLNKDGLDPDLQVKLSEDDINAGKDPQMDSALGQFMR